MRTQAVNIHRLPIDKEICTYFQITFCCALPAFSTLHTAGLLFAPVTAHLLLKRAYVSQSGNSVDVCFVVERERKI